MFFRATSRSNRRRARKASPDPSPYQRQHLPPPAVVPRSPGDGEWTMSSRRRRGGVDADAETLLSLDSLLPTTFRQDHEADSPRGGGSRRRPPSQLPTFQAGNTCNNFLLGGQFYPGKDKMRRQYHLRRRRALWFRIFCSSPIRMGASVLVVSYVLLWHVLVPMTQAMLEYGRMMSGGRYGHILESSNEFKLLPINQARKQALRLQTERDRIQYGDPKRHELSRQIWEDVVPKWLHRNDDKATKTLLKSAKEHQASPKPKQATRDEVGGPLSNASTDTSESGSRRATGKDGDEDPAAPDERITVKETRQTSKIVKNETDSDASPETKRAAAPRSNETASIGNTANQNRTAPSNALTIPDRVFDAARDDQVLTLHNMDSFEPTSNCPASLTKSNIGTTLVVQTTVDRVWLLHETCSRWKDPIVAVVHLSATTSDIETLPILGNATEACPQLTILRYRAEADEEGAGYPVNRLRNIGLDAVNTTHILVADVDFVPSVDLPDTIRSTLASQPDLLESRQAIVVPAFERIIPEPCESADACRQYLQQNSSFIPKTVDELSHCVSAKNCSVFQQSVNWEGHHSTRSESWLKGNWHDTRLDETTGQKVKRIRQVKCFDSLRYEPYVVLRWCPFASEAAPNSQSESENRPQPMAPYYDERFHGYGKNKIQLISHIRFMGYRFSVLPKGFIVHHPHPESASKQAWNDVKENELHATMDKLYPQFLRDVYNKYKETTDYIVDQCDRGRKNKNKQSKKAKKNLDGREDQS